MNAESQVIGEQQYLDLKAPPFRPENKIVMIKNENPEEEVGGAKLV